MGIKNKQNGFTIVELLIVIVVIGILAAIVIVAFNGIQDRAVATTVKSDLTNVHKKLLAYKAQSDTNTYPVNGTQLLAVDISLSKNSYMTPTTRNNVYYCASSDGSTYAFGVASSKDKGYIMTDGAITEPGTSASVYGSHTCTAAGWATQPTGSQAPQSGWLSSSTPPRWADWVKG